MSATSTAGKGTCLPGGRRNLVRLPAAGRIAGYPSAFRRLLRGGSGIPEGVITGLSPFSGAGIMTSTWY